MFRALLLLLCFSIFISANAQFFPGEGDVVNYRLVGFTVPKDSKAEKYMFEVSEYVMNDKGKADRKHTLKQVSDSNRSIMMLPYFDQPYEWRVSYLNAKGKVIYSTPYYHFRTGKYPTIDTSKYHVKVIDSATHHDDVFIIMDYVSVIYDLKGNPVWYLPDIKLTHDKNAQMRDVQPTKSHTFTAAGNFTAFEFDYNGKILWEAPNDGKVSGDTSEHYHHEFTKLDNGNYMAASMEFVWRRTPDYLKLTITESDSGLYQIRNDTEFYRKIPACNIIEYNHKKEVVWYWKSLDHFTDEDIFRKRNHGAKGLDVDMHMNAFDFDEKNKVIYLSYRNMNEITKISYPSGQILKRYSTIWKDDTTKTDNRLFYGQHCIRTTDDGRLYLFDNNSNHKLLMADSTNRLGISHVSVFKEDNSKTGINKIWDFTCDIDTFAPWRAGAGGSVAMLDDGCILANMGSASRIFIVTPDKKIAWNAIPEFSDENNNWYGLGQYRACFITRTELEKFIFR